MLFRSAASKSFLQFAFSVTVMALMDDRIPDAVEGTAPGLEEITRTGARQRAPSTCSHQSNFSVTSSVLAEKGLAGAPVAEKHFSKVTGKPYWRFRRSDGKACFMSKASVEELGFAWYTFEGDLSKGMLKDPKTGRTVSHEHAKTVIGSQAGDDVANLQDLQAFDTLTSVNEDSDSNELASGQNPMRPNLSTADASKETDYGNDDMIEKESRASTRISIMFVSFVLTIMLAIFLLANYKFPQEIFGAGLPSGSPESGFETSSGGFSAHSALPSP